ncbi:TPA: DUF1617 family protein, partial [Streptococcus equi subsp. equi]|nr:DUF1617 family protein [Streptococcus equi subsp. equi]HEK9253811.1 DUF1617 family protein [Streptococcus equi subsp. equi]HEK9590641.1 DUF1617 family protein [Streptococcus equi subsp. equi]HEK9751314.1 DUF1617 family protein [Streptococcus equi subsp. equi]
EDEFTGAEIILIDNILEQYEANKKGE